MSSDLPRTQKSEACSITAIRHESSLGGASSPLERPSFSVSQKTDLEVSFIDGAVSTPHLKYRFRSLTKPIPHCPPLPFRAVCRRRRQCHPRHPPADPTGAAPRRAVLQLYLAIPHFAIVSPAIGVLGSIGVRRETAKCELSAAHQVEVYAGYTEVRHVIHE